MITADEPEIARALKLLVSPGDTYEIRAIATTNYGRGEEILSGYFRGDTASAVVARSDSRDVIGWYVTLNPVDPALHARRADRIAKVGKDATTKDHHIKKRTRLMIDIDPARPTGISSSEPEHEAALALTGEIEHELGARGWPEPLRCDSGNGGHLIYGIDLPTEDAGLVERVLAAAAARWSCDVDGVKLKIDVANANPARITKLYGTPARKGDSVADRPHRLSRVLRAPDALQTVTREQLEAFALEHKPAPAVAKPVGVNGTRTNGMKAIDASEWLARFGIGVRTSGPWSGKHGPGTLYELAECPHSSEHGERGEAFVIQFASGALDAGCHHNGCKASGWGWDWLRERYEGPKPTPGQRTSTRDAPHDADRGYTIVDPPAPDKAPEHTTTPGTFEHELAVALADVKAALGSSATVKRAPLFGDVAELLAREFTAPTWLVTGLITRGGITTIGAEPKAAKTWLGTEIAVAVATGTKVCGEFFAERGVVVYFYAEDLDKQVRNRVRALLAGRSAALGGGRFFARPRGMFLDITRDEDLAWIVASCRKLGPIDLLVLDPLRDISSAAEDKSDEMGPLMRRLRLLAELLGCTVAIVHHTAKLSEASSKRRPGQRLRGSGAIHGSTDSGIYLGEVDGDGSHVFRNSVDSEVKGARSAGRFHLELTVEDNDQGEAIIATYKVSRSVGGTSTKEKAQNADDTKVREWVRDLAIKGVRLSRTALRNREDDRPVAEKRVVAALERLLEAGQIVLHLGAVWLPGQVPPSAA